jgi:sec-independent protein translocase protein TatC
VTTAVPPKPRTTPPAPADQQFSLAPPRDHDFDPDRYRMSVGDHLEELRARLIKALIGVFIAFFGGLTVAKQFLLPYIAGPLIAALKAADVTPQMFFTNVTDPFFVYLRLSMIAAFVVAGPWVLWQAWQFIAAGLYRHERKAVTRYLPLSLALFFGGIAFAWWVVLPWTLSFFLGWSMTIPMPDEPPTRLVADDTPALVAMLDGDPAAPQDGQLWYNRLSRQLKMQIDGKPRVLAFNPTNLAAPIITLPQYVSLVLMMLIVFGLSFQIPIVVMALIRTGIVEPEVLRQHRKYVYFVMVVAACVITPGDVIIMTVSLIGPLIILYEAGIWLGERDVARRPKVK